MNKTQLRENRRPTNQILVVQDELKNKEIIYYLATFVYYSLQVKQNIHFTNPPCIYTYSFEFKSFKKSLFFVTHAHE